MSNLLVKAKPPTLKWRLYVFKVDKEVEEPYKLSGSATKYLVGRDRAVVDIPSDHPSCSKTTLRVTISGFRRRRRVQAVRV
jgi:smad nuclear-interacting protein 1